MIDIMVVRYLDTAFDIAMGHFYIAIWGDVRFAMTFTGYTEEYRVMIHVGQCVKRN